MPRRLGCDDVIDGDEKDLGGQVRWGVGEAGRSTASGMDGNGLVG
jgi:hypothetical protein